MAGLLFTEPRLAQIYDALHPDRSDLDPYLAIVDDLDPTSVLDLGCGTGTFACRLAQLGKRVVGMDPAQASIDVAQRKPGSEQVRWIVGDATAMPDLQLDMVTMTGNVGEHLSDQEWAATLDACHAALKHDGHLVFGSRNPAGEPWLKWNRDATFGRVEIPGVGTVEDWLDITGAGPRHFSFRWTFRFEQDATTFNWDATFRVRTQREIVDALEAASFTVVDVHNDKIFIARPTHAPE